jgi:hypothetical protein
VLLLCLLSTPTPSQGDAYSWHSPSEAQAACPTQGGSTGPGGSTQDCIRRVATCCYSAAGYLSACSSICHTSATANESSGQGWHPPRGPREITVNMSVTSPALVNTSPVISCGVLTECWTSPLRSPSSAVTNQFSLEAGKCRETLGPDVTYQHAIGSGAESSARRQGVTPRSPRTMRPARHPGFETQIVQHTQKLRSRA